MKRMAGIGMVLLSGIASSCKRTADPVMEKKCRDQIMQVGIYFALYEGKYKAYPMELGGIERRDMCTDMSICHCPFAPAGTSYAYRGMEAGPMPGDDFVMAYDAVPHPDGCRHVVYAKVRVSKLTEAEFKKALEAK